MVAMWTFALARLAGILALGLCLGLLIGPIWLWILSSYLINFYPLLVIQNKDILKKKQ